MITSKKVHVQREDQLFKNLDWRHHFPSQVNYVEVLMVIILFQGCSLAPLNSVNLIGLAWRPKAYTTVIVIENQNESLQKQGFHFFFWWYSKTELLLSYRKHPINRPSSVPPSLPPSGKLRLSILSLICPWITKVTPHNPYLLVASPFVQSALLECGQDPHSMRCC